jgi:hypothetical protein
MRINKIARCVVGTFILINAVGVAYAEDKLNLDESELGIVNVYGSAVSFKVDKYSSKLSGCYLATNLISNTQWEIFAPLNELKVIKVLGEKDIIIKCIGYEGAEIYRK